ncbi:glycosyltransferase family 39 protein [Candidatus Woesearchaeota archaeon]|nr:glycosyltransferase family 39 protein [Candidatus Woesearchaeota archaeon]
MNLSRFRSSALIRRLKSNPLLLILSITVLSRLIYLCWDYPLWWDSHIYIGLGKYIFSAGEAGIWEPFRPLVHPFILGLLWKLNLNVIIIGKIMDIIFSTFSVFLVYRITQKIYGQNTAIFSSILLSLTPVFIMFTGLILTEPLALFLGLLGAYYFFKEPSQKNLFLGGLFGGLSFLTKFPMGILFLAMISAILISKKTPMSPASNCYRILFLTLGFLTPLIPYLILNYFLYQDIFLPFVVGSWIVTTATWFYGSGWTYYFDHFFLGNVLYLLFLPAVILFLKRKEWQDYRRSTLFLASILILAYFWYLPRKETRYLVLALPSMAILTGEFISYLYSKTKARQKQVLKPLAFVVLFGILLLFPLPLSLDMERPPTFEKEVSQVIKVHNIDGEVLTSDPAFVSFLNQPIVTLDGMGFSTRIYEQQKGKYQLIFLNHCYLACPPEDTNCLTQKKQFLSRIYSENTLEFTTSFKNCTYAILLPKS